MTTVTVRIDTEVDVDLDDVDTDDLINEIETRGIKCIQDREIEDFDELDKIYHLITFGLKDRAIEEMHSYLREKLGKTL